MRTWNGLLSDLTCTETLWEVSCTCSGSHEELSSNSAVLGRMTCKPLFATTSMFCERWGSLISSFEEVSLEVHLQIQYVNNIVFHYVKIAYMCILFCFFFKVLCQEIILKWKIVHSYNFKLSQKAAILFVLQNINC